MSKAVEKIERGNTWKETDKVVQVEVKKPLDKVIPVRLSSDKWEQIRREARELGVGPTTLARMWILERLKYLVKDQSNGAENRKEKSRMGPDLLFIPSNFQAFLQIHNQHYDPNSEPNYRKLINRYNSTGDYLKILDEEYIHLCYEALDKEFGMNRQGAKLVSESAFKSSIIEQKLRLSDLSQYRLEQFKSGQRLTGNLFSELWVLFSHLQVMASSSKLVGMSKTLHFLLPNLVMPIDRRNVLRFLFLSDSVPLSLNEQFKKLRQVFEKYTDLAQHLNLNVHNGDGNWWNISVPKRIDNAIEGFWYGLDREKLSFASPNRQS